MAFEIKRRVQRNGLGENFFEPAKAMISTVTQSIKANLKANPLSLTNFVTATKAVSNFANVYKDTYDPGAYLEQVTRPVIGTPLKAAGHFVEREIIQPVFKPIAAVMPKITIAGHTYDLGGTRMLIKTAAGAVSGAATGAATSGNAYGAIAGAIVGGVAANFQKGEPDVARDLTIGAAAGAVAGSAVSYTGVGSSSAGTTGSSTTTATTGGGEGISPNLLQVEPGSSGLIVEGGGSGLVPGASTILSDGTIVAADGTIIGSVAGSGAAETTSPEMESGITETEVAEGTAATGGAGAAGSGITPGEVEAATGAVGVVGTAYNQSQRGSGSGSGAGGPQDQGTGLLEGTTMGIPNKVLAVAGLAAAALAVVAFSGSKKKIEA